MTWRAHSGRGKRGELCFLQSPTQFREQLLQQQLDNGLSHQALELVQLAPEQLNQLLKPFMGGQWLDDCPTLRIPCMCISMPRKTGFAWIPPPVEAG